MKVWKIWSPFRPEYAEFDGTKKRVEREGIWRDPHTLWNSVADQYGICRECTAPPPSDFLAGLLVEWKPGSDVIGDFSWDESGCYPIVKDNVFLQLNSNFEGIVPAQVEYHQNARLKRPTHPSRRSRPRIWLPYKGPQLLELVVKARSHIDPKLSTARAVVSCRTCGYERWEAGGVEEYEHHWDNERRLSFRVRRPRKPRHGLYVHKADLQGADFFRFHEFPGWDMCTDDVKRFIEVKGYTNIDFYEMGEVVE